MKRTLIGIGTLALIVAACGGGDGSDTTIASDTAVEDAGASNQTPPPETTPDLTTASTTPLETPTTSASGGAYSEPGASGDTTTSHDMDDMATSGGLSVAETDLGQILVGPDEMSLYVFLPDSQGESTCYDACAETWPPLTGDVTAGEGADESLLGTVERTDGSTQATYNDWPLYYYAPDEEPGDVSGQGVGDNWFVIDPAGEVVEG
ncbi:MAG TPA: hypothetical protein VHL52_07250 [Acidimicrobiia bacterium]|nr:hypothetical protein [Acidimicrobiia bacterium]